LHEQVIGSAAGLFRFSRNRLPSGVTDLASTHCAKPYTEIWIGGMGTRCGGHGSKCERNLHVDDRYDSINFGLVFLFPAVVGNSLSDLSPPYIRAPYGDDDSNMNSIRFL